MVAAPPPAERTLPALLARQARDIGDRTVLVAGAIRWTFADALDQARRFGGTLAAAGVARGDRVALLCANRPEFLRVVLGCAWIGAVVVPINLASRGAQLRHILDNCGARLLIAESAPARAVEALAESPAALRDRWLIADGSPEPAGLDWRPLPDLGEAVEPAALGPGDLFAILYTSGTTGPSKGVCCPHAQYVWWGVYSARILGLRPDDVLLTTLPLFHTNALNAFFQALVTGATLVVEPRFSASGFAPALLRHRATITYLLGAMVPILLSRDASADDRAHQVRLALAPGVPARFQQAFGDRFGVPLVDGYGSTETNFCIAGEPGRTGSMGHLRDGFAAYVADADDNRVPDGEPGELLLRADEPFAFATGYFGMPEKTVEAWRNLWFHTGDRVVRSPEGEYRFLDRMKDAIRRRGENISAFEVEQVLLGHPAIANVAVFPQASELAEDEVGAAIVLHRDMALPPAELIAFCAPLLPYFAVPRFLDFVDALPMTENGKVQKFRLRERGISAATWDREAAGIVVAR